MSVSPSAGVLPGDIPAEAVPFLEEMGYLEPDRLSVGVPAPDVPLLTPHGEELRSSQLSGSRPVVLIFGSYT